MGFIELLWAYILVFIFSAVPFFEAYAVIPVAIIAGLATFPVLVLGLGGNIITVLLVIVFINKIKQWQANRKKNKEEKSPSKRSLRAQKLWKKYGLPGLAMIGPLFVGSHLTAFMSISLGGTKKETAYWVIGTIVIWSAIFTVLAHLGIDFLGFQDRGIFQNINIE